MQHAALTGANWNRDRNRVGIGIVRINANLRPVFSAKINLVGANLVHIHAELNVVMGLFEAAGVARRNGAVATPAPT